MDNLYEVVRVPVTKVEHYHKAVCYVVCSLLVWLNIHKEMDIYAY